MLNLVLTAGVEPACPEGRLGLDQLRLPSSATRAHYQPTGDQHHSTFPFRLTRT